MGDSTKQIDFDLTIKGELFPLRNFALSLTRNLEDANDLVQETVLKAYKYREKFQPDTNIRAWMFTILRNTFINEYRRKARRNTFLDSTEDTYFLDLPSHKTENEGEQSFLRRDLESSVGDLPSNLRVPFILNAEGFKYHEIAEKMKVPIGTIKTRIFTAKRILRKKLQDYGKEFV